jgi:hypothetical protein
MSDATYGEDELRERDPAELPEGVRKEILEADEVRVVAPILTTRLQSWASDIDAAAVEATSG